jgi:hypothetical protein
MTDNYEAIARSNLDGLFRKLPQDLDRRMQAEKAGKTFSFSAFGETCIISPEGIFLGDGRHPSVLRLLISLYALHATDEPCILEPFSAYKDFPGSGPYAPTFTTHTEHLLVPQVDAIEARTQEIKASMEGTDAPPSLSGDFSFLLYPLPKIALCYIFYEADEDFPASVTCLFSANARIFLPMDALADVGEYTSRKILRLIES